MVNNWVMQREKKKPELPEEFDKRPRGYKLNVKFEAYIGDYIASNTTKQNGVVVGLIRNRFGDNVCYKVLCQEFATDKYDKVILNKRTKKPKILNEFFDYIPVPLITEHKPCESMEEVLSSIGYEWVDADPKDKNDNGHYYCKTREDVIFC